MGRWPSGRGLACYAMPPWICIFLKILFWRKIHASLGCVVLHPYHEDMLVLMPDTVGQLGN